MLSRHMYNKNTTPMYVYVYIYMYIRLVFLCDKAMLIASYQLMPGLFLYTVPSVPFSIV